MEYSKLISKIKQYKYSANINFDLRNEEKLLDFIPNQTTTDILREYLDGIINNNTDTHSRILYGSYGTGKSHLLTVISAILGHINTNGTKGITTLLERIKTYDKPLAEDIKKFTKDEKPFLVVPVYSDYSDFNRCITYSLKKALDDACIKAAFKGFFDEALSLTNKWIKGKESVDRLEEECKKREIDIDQLQQGLKNYDLKYEKKFNAIYSGMSFGATFNSRDANLVENLSIANEAIKNRYQGIVIVFDEFGRYVEDYGDDIKVKAIQDLAEYCDHGDYKDYLILVSHKQLSMYTGVMTKSISEEWKKVEGRFKTTSINTKYDQYLSLIEYIIPKTNKWADFKKRYAKELQALYEQAWDFKGFYLPPQTHNRNPFEGGFPLHPITLYALDRLSKKVAQNERTFFTYLAGDEENALFAQLSKLDDSEFHFIGLDALYDYFEVNIKAYKTDEAYAIYKKLQFAINKLGQSADPLKIRVLKAMAVIYIISDADVIVADRETLIHVIDAKDNLIDRSIKEMEQSKIIRFMRQYSYYDFFDSSIFDLEKMIEEVEEGVSEETVVNVLNDEFSDFVLYPYRYNENFHMNRVFIPAFSRKEDVEKKSFFRTLPKLYDGVVIFVLDHRSDIEDYKAMHAPERSILLINTDAKSVEHEVKRYVAIQYYCSKKDELAKDDPTVVNELALYLNEQKAIVDEMVRKWRTITLNNIEVVVDGQSEKLDSAYELSSVASDIMEREYNHTIIINNDLLNKIVLSGAMKQARIKALGYIISNQENIYEGCQVLSPEFNVIRSVLTNTGIYSGGDIPAGRIPEFDDIHMVTGQPTMTVINAFLEEATKGQKDLIELYDKLKMPPLGLRDGYISVLLAYALRSYENVSIYFHGKEHDYTEEELVKAIENASDYSIYVSNWNEEQETYIQALEKIFNEFIASGGTQNRISRLFSAMNTHYASISKSARTTELFVSDMTKKYRDIMNLSYSNITRFFFEKLTAINPDLQELVIQIQDIKEELEAVPKKQLGAVMKVIRTALDIKDEESIVDNIEKRYNNDWKKKNNRAFDYLTNNFLEFVGRNDFADDNDFAKRLAKVMSGFEIEYWNDSKLNDFQENLVTVIGKLAGYTNEDVFDNNDVRVTIDTGDENKIVSEFSRGELSSAGQLMLNKLRTDIDNFGESISYEEKINIITRILRDAIK